MPGCKSGKRGKRREKDAEDAEDAAASEHVCVLAASELAGRAAGFAVRLLEQHVAQPAIQHAARATMPMSCSQTATTTVATQLPIRLVSARDADEPVDRQDQHQAEHGMPCAPFEVTSETSSTTIRSCADSGVLVACAMNSTASVR